MARIKSNVTPIWKQVIAVLILVYAILVWCMPIFLLLFVYILPYVHQSNFLQRLVVSAACSVLIFLILFALSPKQFVSNFRSPERSVSGKAKHWLLSLLGFAMFTYLGAELSPNLFGALTYVLPATTFSETTNVKVVESAGSNNKAVLLTLQGQSNGSPLYLVLSRRLFDYPRFKTGDVLVISGRQTMLGAYVTNFELVGNRLTNHSTGPAKKAAQAGEFKR